MGLSENGELTQTFQFSYRENDDDDDDGDRENDDDKILMSFKRENDYEPLESGYLIYPQRLCVLSISHRVSRVCTGPFASRPFP